MASPEITEAYAWQGRTIVGSDGEEIGKVDEIYLDERSDQPEWATVKTGLFGNKSHFVPLAGAAPDAENVRVRVTKDQVKDAPSIDPDGQLSEAQESHLFEHYHVPYTREGSLTAEGAPAERQLEETDSGRGAEATGSGHDTSGPTTDGAMTRSEEELHVSTQQRERGRARLRKYVVTEMVTKTVPVQREEVRIEREPITDANRGQATDGPAISGEEHEVVLHEDEPVLEKRVVAKERVRMGTDTVGEDREISEEVRKEQIDEPETTTR